MIKSLLQYIEYLFMTTVSFFVINIFNYIYMYFYSKAGVFYRIPAESFFIIAGVCLFVSKLFFIKYEERHSFIPIIVTLFINYGILFSLGYFYKKIFESLIILVDKNILLLVIVGVFVLTCFITELLLMGMIIAPIHSLFYDKIRISWLKEK